MEKELVSIIIPVYNRSEIISDTIDNILKQTYENIEIIVVNDGSTDNINEVMTRYENNEKIRYINNSINKGACHARNVGVESSKGNYIAFQDSDDLWDKEKIYKQLEYLKFNNADICICGMNSHYKNGVIKKFHSESFSNSLINLSNQLGKNFFSTQLIFGKRECFFEEKFDESFPRFQDWDLGIRLVKKYKVVFLPDVLVHRFLQTDSISADNKRGYIAAKLLLDKYSAEYEHDKTAKAKLLLVYSRFQELNGESSRESLKFVLKNNFSIKIFIIYILQLFGLYRVILKKKRRIK